MIVEQAYAKLNLALDVINKRQDGYHDLEMIMVPLELHDTLTFEPSNQVELITNLPIENNLIIKTVNHIKDKYSIDKGARITLEKQIPIGGGLAGGSADVAATIRGLNQLWALNLSEDEKREIALSLGSDTLFCLYNRPAYVYGRGEHVDFLNPIYIPTIFLFPSLVEVSTKKVFEHHLIKPSLIEMTELVDAYQKQAYNRFFKDTYNALTETTLRVYPMLKKEIKVLNKLGVPIFMTGSGSTFFTLLFDEDDEPLLKKILKKRLNFIKTRTKT